MGRDRKGERVSKEQMAVVSTLFDIRSRNILDWDHGTPNVPIDDPVMCELIR